MLLFSGANLPDYHAFLYNQVFCDIAIVDDDDVEATPIYRCDGKPGQPIIRPHKNHDLCMKREPTQTESGQKQQTQSKAVPTSMDHWIENPKSKDHNEHIWFVVRLSIGPVTASLTN